MAQIVLSTLNARYIHSAFGLRYLLANLGDLRPKASLLEFEIKDPPLHIVETLMAEKPRIVGLGVYIWNVTQTTHVVATLKRLCPEVMVVLGGPEVSYETLEQPIVKLADFVVIGEGEKAFAQLCQQLLEGNPPQEKVIRPPLPAIDELALPYGFYDEEDVAHRVIYVEASRGCPFRCEFCLSSLDQSVRKFPLQRFLDEMHQLFQRGARRFKFVDRTFNLNWRVGQAILEFFHSRYEPGLFLHFEMIPDRFPEQLRVWIGRFPPGTLQFEVGIQTFDVEVAARISRRQDYAKLEQNLSYLREHTGVHVHADLIVGLPGESVESFGVGFDRLVALGPQEIQVGILKRLRGTPIVRHSERWGMLYDPQPPYEILQTANIDFVQMQRMRRFARYWDLVGNSGNFLEVLPLFWENHTPFNGFMRFCDALYAEERRLHRISLERLIERVFVYLQANSSCAIESLALLLWRGYQGGGRLRVPKCLKPFLQKSDTKAIPSKDSSLPSRQARHLVSKETPVV